MKRDPSALESKAAEFDRLLLAIGLRLLQSFASESLDLNIREMLMVELLGERGQATMSDLASALSTPRTTMTSTVGRMVRRGIVRRRRVEDDRRVVLVSLTSKGSSLHRQHRREHIAAASAVLGRLDAKERDQLMRAMERVLAVLSHETPEEDEAR